jgi:hypothetical protein
MLFRAQHGIDSLPQTAEDGNVVGEEPVSFGREWMLPEVISPLGDNREPHWSLAQPLH